MAGPSRHRFKAFLRRSSLLATPTCWQNADKRPGRQAPRCGWGSTRVWACLTLAWVYLRLESVCLTRFRVCLKLAWVCLTLVWVCLTGTSVRLGFKSTSGNLYEVDLQRTAYGAGPEPQRPPGSSRAPPQQLQQVSSLKLSDTKDYEP